MRTYYDVLGIDRNADSNTIKKAYKEKAKQYHPDRNTQDTTAEFQLILEAYQVLSDEEKRARYDAYLATKDNTPTVHHPIRCDRCGKISAQPRYVNYYRTLGLFVISLHRTYGNILCPYCYTHIAYRFAWFNGILGILGPAGPYFVIEYIIKNVILMGSKPKKENAQILKAQGDYFLSVGKRDLAYECYEKAMKFTKKKDRGELQSILADMPIPAKRLKNKWKMPWSLFAAQMAAIAVFVGIFIFFMFFPLF